ncbi:hypothetical protein Q8A67_012279 [Cirrhinus molitorella]|uniref:Uncharacterized protein n=1 Tax=Cirrhinus molitorella TaxID=172907 RepID=A0AA88PS34_9TELE|nr:hypothetical protein Q8A67_012279 [Cirrhinus molitorella]
MERFNFDRPEFPGNVRVGAEVPRADCAGWKRGVFVFYCFRFVYPEGTGGCLKSTLRFSPRGTQTSASREKTSCHSLCTGT